MACSGSDNGADSVSVLSRTVIWVVVVSMGKRRQKRGNQASGDVNPVQTRGVMVLG